MACINTSSYSCHYRVTGTHRVVAGVGLIKRSVIQIVEIVTDKLPMLGMVKCFNGSFLFVNELHSVLNDILMAFIVFRMCVCVII